MANSVKKHISLVGSSGSVGTKRRGKKSKRSKSPSTDAKGKAYGQKTKATKTRGRYTRPGKG